MWVAGHVGWVCFAPVGIFFFFLNDPATTDIYPLPLPDPLPISVRPPPALHPPCGHLLSYAHNGDGVVRSSSVCLFRLRLQPAPSGWGIATARRGAGGNAAPSRSEEHTSELQSRLHIVCRLLLEK